MRGIYTNAARNLSSMGNSTRRWLDCTTRGNSVFVQNNYYGGCCCCGGGNFWSNMCSPFLGGLGMGLANGIMGLCNWGMGMWPSMGMWPNMGMLGGSYFNNKPAEEKHEAEKPGSTEKEKIKIEKEYVQDIDNPKFAQITTDINALTADNIDESSVISILNSINDAIKTTDDNQKDKDLQTYNNLKNLLRDRCTVLGYKLNLGDTPTLTKDEIDEENILTEEEKNELADLLDGELDATKGKITIKEQILFEQGYSDTTWNEASLKQLLTNLSEYKDKIRCINIVGCTNSDSDDSTYFQGENSCNKSLSLLRADKTREYIEGLEEYDSDMLITIDDNHDERNGDKAQDRHVKIEIILN